MSKYLKHMDVVYKKKLIQSSYMIIIVKQTIKQQCLIKVILTHQPSMLNAIFKLSYTGHGIYYCHTEPLF